MLAQSTLEQFSVLDDHVVHTLVLLLVQTHRGHNHREHLLPGVEAFGGHHYLLVDDVEDLSWDKAKQQCEDWGAHLVVVTQAAEAAFIAKLCDERYMYLGASDAAEEGTWVWVDGSEWDFTHWHKGQPNDYAGGENYLATYDRGEWVDVDGSGDDFWMPTGYICEWGD